MDDRLAQLIARPIAHRGLHACGQPGPVENSLSAAAAAVAAGYGIECDVQLSRDGEAIVIHDDDLMRLTGTVGRVGEAEAAYLGTLPLRGTADVVPRLSNLLDLVAGRVPLVIEVKSRNDGDMRLVARTLALVADYAGAVAIESFDPAVVLYARAQGMPCPLGLVGPSEAGEPADPRAVAASDFLSWSIERLDDAPQRPGLALTSWTVRTQAQMDHAARCGAQIVFEGFSPSRDA